MLAFNSYLHFLDCLNQSAIATTAAGVVVDWNESAERLYGWNRTDAVGRNIVDVTPATLSRHEAEEIMQSLGSGQIWSGEFPVRTRAGDTFIASVTDVPIVDEGEHVVGVVGVSAPSRRSSSLMSVLLNVGAACEVLWPGRVELSVRDGRGAVPASEPHVLQLLSLLVMRYAEALEGGSTLAISVSPAAESVFADFGIRTKQPFVYIRFALNGEARSYSVLRDEIASADRTNYGAALVRLLGGWLVIESGGKETRITHLLLPVSH